MLSQLGFDSNCAADGITALKMVRTRCDQVARSSHNGQDSGMAAVKMFKVIFLDYSMELTNGPETALQIR